MNINSMTPNQLRALAAKKESEANKTVKVGYLKHDLYRYQEDYLDYYLDDSLTEREVKKEISDLKQRVDAAFEVCLHKGTKFERRYAYGDYLWSDATGEISDRDDAWAKKHLERIQNV